MKLTLFRIFLLTHLITVCKNNAEAQDKKVLAIYSIKPTNIENDDLSENVTLAVNAAFFDSEYEVRLNTEWEYVPGTPSGAVAMESEALHVIYSAAQGIRRELSKKEQKLVGELKEKIAANYIGFVHLIRNLAKKSQEYEVRIVLYDIYTHHYSASPIVVYFDEFEIQNISTIKNRVMLNLYNNAERNSRPSSDEERKKDFIRNIEILVKLKHFNPENKHIQESVDAIKANPIAKIAFLNAEIELANEKFEEACEKKAKSEMIDWLKLIIENYETLIDISDNEGLKNEYIKLRRTYQQILKVMEKH